MIANLHEAAMSPVQVCPSLYFQRNCKTSDEMSAVQPLRKVVTDRPINDDRIHVHLKQRETVFTLASSHGFHLEATVDV